MKLVSFFVVSASVRLYSLLFWLYPASLRLEYGKEMKQLFSDLCWDEMQQGRDLLGIIKLWLCVLTEIAVITRQQHFLVGSSYRRQRHLKRVIWGIIWMLLMISGWLFWLHGGVQLLHW